jgi:hypothetical protein
MTSANVRAEALRIAGTQADKKVRETSRNSGPEVDAYLRSVGLGPGYAWCAAFVHWCFDQGSAALALDNPCPRTAGALHLWDLCDPHMRDSESGAGPFVPVQPGDVFVIDHGHGLGHVGFIESRKDDASWWTVEGNTNPGGSREGDGVYRRTRRRDEITRGYLRIGG